MGRLESRIGKLEDVSRERAEAAIKALYDGLTDEELALLLAPLGGITLSGGDEAKREKAERKLNPEEMDRLMRLAAPPEGFEDQEECDRWIRGLNERLVYPGGRRKHLRRLLKRLEEEET